MEKVENWYEQRKSKTNKWIKQKLEPLENFIWAKCCVPLFNRYDKGPKDSKSNEEHDWKETVGTDHQLG